MKKLLTLTTLFIATSAMAGFNTQTKGGFTNNVQDNAITVAQALKAKDNSIVAVKGKIVKQLDDDEFIFADSTGEIKIEVEDKAWNGHNITPNDTIIIQAKVDNEMFEKTTLDVFSVEK